MATLSLARRDVRFDPALTNAFPFSEWLGGQWALLFSHPDDFSCLDLESDRWAFMVQDAFDHARVRPVALAASTPRYDGQWIAQVSDGESPMLLLETPRRQYEEEVALNSNALRSVIARTTSRFVMIIDESLRLRRTFAYSLQDRLPSLLDFAATVNSLRKEPLRPRETEPVSIAARQPIPIPVASVRPAIVLRPAALVYG
jgi:alkyl hydroperoxide reductase subunit AhpC